MPSQMLNRSGIGAWVLKASPTVWDVNQMIDAREPPPQNFRLHDSYRVHLVEVDGPVWLWATASRTAPRRPARFVAAGVVVDLAGEGRGGGPYWIDDKEAGKLRPYLPVEPEWLDVAVTADELRAHPVLSSFELLRATSMSNPSYLTPEQDAGLRELAK